MILYGNPKPKYLKIIPLGISFYSIHLSYVQHTWPYTRDRQTKQNKLKKIAIFCYREHAFAVRLACIVGKNCNILSYYLPRKCKRR